MRAGDIQAAVRKHRLFACGQHMLVAVSGGADSVCLLHVLRESADELGIELSVAHLDHRLRGAESAEDAGFVAQLCADLGIRCRTGSADVRRRARAKGLSLEMAAREARYEFLARSARSERADMIATAHTADDQAETVLLKLARGAGPGGLCGIPRRTAMHGVPVVRPLLDVGRSAIETFLTERGLEWHEDVSNADPAFLRNRVRHEILPLLERRLNPAVRHALCRTAEVLSDEEAWLDGLVDDLTTTCTRPGPDGAVALELAALGALGPGPRRRVVRRWLVSEGLSAELVGFDTVARVDGLATAGRSGGAVDIGAGWTVRNRYGKLVLVPGGVVCGGSGFRQAVNIPGETLLSDAGLRVEVSIESGVVKPAPSRAGSLPACASISRTALRRRRLYVRSWRQGDRIRPLGMAGSKKIQDIFVDDKVPPEQRFRVPLFECGGEIVWLPGYRVARGWEVTYPALPAVRISVDKMPAPRQR